MIRKQTVTLYVDDASIRLLVASGRKIKKWADLPLEPGLIKGMVVLKEKEVATKIRQLFVAKRIKTKKVILGFSGLHSMTRPVTLPSLPKAMLAEAVTRTAGKALSIPLEQLYLSWQAMPAPAGKSQAFVVAVPHKTADALVKTLRQAGLEPSHMALKPLVLTKAIREATAILLDVQPTEFDVVIVADRIPHPVRTVSLPTEVPSLQEKLPLIINELDRTIKFFNSNNPQKPLDASVPVYVSGELTNAPELQKALSDALGHPVSALSSPLVRPPTLELNRYMTSVALSFNGHLSGKELRSTAAGLNVLPAPYQPKPISLFRVIAAPAIILILLLIAGLFMLMQTISTNTAYISGELNSVERLIKQRQTEQQELRKSIPELEKSVASAKSSSSALNLALSTLDRKHDQVSNNLKLALGTLPSGASLTDVKQVENKLTINGTAPKEDEVLYYAGSLDSSGVFAETVVTSIKRASDGSVQFSLDLKIKE